MLGVAVDQLPDGRGRGRKASGSDHYRWNDGRIITDDGYVKVRVGIEHPLADPNGYAYEHLVVWCSAGNTRPSDDETLHHRSEDKGDNRIRNLELLTRGDHNALHIAERGRRPNGQFKKAAGRLLDGVQHDGYPEAQKENWAKHQRPVSEANGVERRVMHWRNDD
jgi:hypothetical protein